ncbi:MAG: hypothetical protein R6U04_03530 [Bacteroidales bacterium]
MDSNKNAFEKILEQETTSLEDELNDWFLYFLIPEKLPDWFFKPYLYASSEDYMIGISDPGMDSVEALQSAVMRAKSLYCLSEETIVETVSDNFVINREEGQPVLASQLMDFTRMTASKIYNDENFVINKKIFTKYGECIVLLSYEGKQISRQTDTLSVSAELMDLVRENTYSIKNTILSKMNSYLHRSSPDAKDGKLGMSYMFRGKRSGVDLVSVFNNDTLYLPIRPYRYLPITDQLTGEEEKMTSDDFTFPVNKGLWNAYVNLVLKKLNFHNNYLKSKVKRSFDNYSSSNQEVVRTVSRNSFSFRIQKIKLYNQRLDLHLDFGN